MELPNFSNLRFVKPTEMKRKTTHGRRSRDYELCPGELSFKDGEVLNTYRDARRVQGADARFRRNPLVGLHDASPQNKQEVMALAALPKVDVSFNNVVEELYATDELTDEQRLLRKAELAQLQRDDEAFIPGLRSDVIPQYYLQETTEAHQVVHIVEDGIFWDRYENLGYGNYVDVSKKDAFTVSQGDRVYTNSILWTNPSATWTWKNSSEKRALRCKINIPTQTQVIVDRSPVYGGTDCERAEDGRISKIPDILLAPAVFDVTSVKYFRSIKQPKEDAKLTQNMYTFVDPGHRGRITDDESYVKYMLQEVDEFVDVTMNMVSVLRLPQPSAA